MSNFCKCGHPKTSHGSFLSEKLDCQRVGCKCSWFTPEKDKEDKADE